MIRVFARAYSALPAQKQAYWRIFPRDLARWATHYARPTLLRGVIPSEPLLSGAESPVLAETLPGNPLFSFDSDGL